MDINIKDIIELSDDHKYQVVSKTTYEGITYYYLVDVNDISNIKFLYENIDRLTEVEDPELVQILLPKLFYEIKDLI